MKPLPKSDLEHVWEFAPMRELIGKRVFINGLGWFGQWIIDCLQANGFYVRARGSKQPYPTSHFDYAIHAASAGTKEFLDFCETFEIRKSLYISSGAIYCRDDEYARTKRNDERLCGEHPANPVIARCFTFVGPRQRLDAQWAVGNFLADALAKRDITVRSDGKSVRSYMHMADLIAWLLTLLVKGTPGRPYNVGSEEKVSIADLASMIGLISGQRVVIESKPSKPDYYVPTTHSAKSLGLQVRIPLKDALKRTWAWLN